MDIERLSSIIEDVCGINSGEITENTRFSDLGIDSLDLAQIIFNVENELEIEIDPDVLEEIVTAGDALEAIWDAQKG